MGIPRLLPLIKRNPSLFENYILRKCSLVIDGKCLEHRLYNYFKINKLCGGDYDVYATKVERFFNGLHKLEIDPFVVFDGAHILNDRTVANQITRAQNRINNEMEITPILIHETFVSALNKMGIKHVTCDFEAWHEMLVLANNLNCPLVSSNSDFFVFQLIRGFISILDMNFNLLSSDADIKILEVKIFYTRNLVSKFPYLEGKLALLAAGLRADYVEDKAKESDAKQMFFRELRIPKPDRDIFEIDNGNFSVIIRKVLYWLENCRHLGAGKNYLMKHMNPSERRALEDFMSLYNNSYKYARFDLHKSLGGFVHEGAGQQILETTCIVRNHRLGRLPTFIQNTIFNRYNFLLCQVEDMTCESSHTWSKPIREVIYGILLGNHERVQECDRCGDKSVIRTVHGVTVSIGTDDIVPNRDNVKKLTKEQRQEILTKAMTVSIPGENIAAFHKSSVIFVMVLIFWLKSSNGDIDFASSLLLCFIILSSLQDKTADPEVVMQIHHIEQSLQRPSPLSLSIECHPFAQFQSCLKYCMYLNKLLDYPVEDINPAIAFRGSLIYKICHTVQENGEPWILSLLGKSHILSSFYVHTMEFIRHNL